MSTKVILLVSIMAILTSCNETKKEKLNTIDTVAKNEKITENLQNNEGYKLMKNNCYACHNPNTKSHDDIIAPPFVAVKRHYTKQYQNKEEFVNAVVSWVQNPTEDKVLMKGAVKRFKLMPKLPLETKKLQKIASYIYDTNIEEPEWFAEHAKEMKGKGMGKGKGKK